MNALYCCFWHLGLWLIWWSCWTALFLHLLMKAELFSSQGESVLKTVFLVFFQGDQLKAKVKKICEGWVSEWYNFICNNQLLTLLLRLQIFNSSEQLFDFKRIIFSRYNYGCMFNFFLLCIINCCPTEK